MKILVLGKDPRPPVEKPWWDGMTLACVTCGTQVQIDVEDRTYRTVDEASGQITAICFSCPVCQKTVTVKRPIATTALAKLAQEHQPV